MSDEPKSKRAKKGEEKSIEEIYQKKSQIEHILLRPDTYIGSVQANTDKFWVWDSTASKMVYRDVTFVPGLFKIFDEILVNAADNKQRDPSMNKIKVEIDAEKCEISVWNNGNGIPVEIHKEHGIHVPELIFGHLLTSSNYDDTEKKVTGGRNGFGAKLTNIFSDQFTVETNDTTRGRKYKQMWKKNMSEKSEPTIKSADKEDYTCITFRPDLEKFGMSSFDEDTLAILHKRVYDIAGCTPSDVKVWLNGKRVAVTSFKDYVELYAAEGSLTTKIYEKPNERWEVCVSVSDGQFQQASFVNSICTTKGGTHVKHVTDQIVSHLQEVVQKQINKGKGKSATKQTAIPPHVIKNHLWVFVNSLVENPAFDSQTKETLNSKISSFGSKCELSDAFFKKLDKSDVVGACIAFAQVKQARDLKKTDGTKKGRITGIAKLDDANDAGTRNSEKCTLILTEGDSAKALAVSGLSIVGRDHYGVFPLRGKLLNVREATSSQVIKNEEISSIKQILGLKTGVVYTEENIKTLRYGHLMIMTDQDHDGSHIKGLIINFLDTYWPSLLKVPGFLREFITPIVKVTKGRASMPFYTIPEYQQWKRDNNDGAGWTIKYYKGLGTSTAAEAKEYFADLETHQVEFVHESDEDTKAIELAFSGKKADERKTWLAGITEETFVDHSVGELSYSDFVNKELILFSMADCQRSIPSLVDGLKPGQRKILFACFKRNLVKHEIKVAQLSGYVAEHSAYHHGEASLGATILGMAQDFVGANNINLLMPNGQFGTRLQGGKDAASPRYIFTLLNQITRDLFPKPDDALLKYLDDDGQSIEPKWYMPILPMCLVNGSAGVGTGWSSSIPNYNPMDIVANLKRMINGEEPQRIHPWYRGFKGTIALEKEAKYRVSGKWEKIDDTTIEVTELPLTWTQDFKEQLEKKMAATPPQIKEYREYHTDTTVHFVISFTPEQMAAAESAGIEKTFKLTSSLATSNMVLFDQEGRIRKYANVEDIFREFYGLRLEYYQKRKTFLVEKLTSEWNMLDNKMRFILAVINGELVVAKRKRDDLLKDLKTRGFDEFAPEKKGSKSKKKESEDSDEDEDGEKESDSSKNGYDYLLRMPLWSLTHEKVEDLKKQRDGKQTELDELLGTSDKELWIRDLDNFVEKYEALNEAWAEAQVMSSKKAMQKRMSKKPTQRKPRAKKPAAPKKEKEEEKKVKEVAAAASSAPKKTTSAASASSSITSFFKPKAASSPSPTKDKDKMDDGSDSDFDNIPSLAERLNAAAPAERPSRAAASKPKARSPSVDDSAMSFEVDDESDEFEPESKKKGKAAASKKSSDDDEKPATKKRAAPAAKSKKAAKSSDSEGESDAPAAKKRKTAATTTKAKTTAAKGGKKSAKKGSDSESEEDVFAMKDSDESEAESKPKRGATAKGKSATAAKPKAAAASKKLMPTGTLDALFANKKKDEESEKEDDVEEEKPKKGGRKPAAAKKPAAPKGKGGRKKKDESESEGEVISLTDSDSDGAPAAAAEEAPQRRSTRGGGGAKKPVSYAISDDSDVDQLSLDEED